MVAGDRAVVTGIDAGLELLMWHRASEKPGRRKKWSRMWNPLYLGRSKRYGRIQS